MISNLPTFLSLTVKVSYMLTISPFDPPLQALHVQLWLSKLPSTTWWNGPLSGVYFLTPTNVSHLFLA